MKEHAQISKVLDHLYISSYASITKERLEALGITAVLNMTAERDNVAFPGLDLKCTKFTIKDRAEANLEQLFEPCIDIIEETRKDGGKILVHCVMGISRSATVIIAYLMKSNGMALREAYYFLKSKRSVIHPNIGFWQQMVNYEMSLYGKTTIEMMPFSNGLVPDVYKNDPMCLIWIRWSSDLWGMIGIFIICFFVDFLHSKYRVTDTL